MYAPLGHDAPSEDESASEAESFDPLQQAAEETAAKVRKRAGLPEIVADALPSAIAMKMMNLFSNILKVLCVEKQNHFQAYPEGPLMCNLPKDLPDQAHEEVAGQPGEVRGG